MARSIRACSAHKTRDLCGAVTGHLSCFTTPRRTRRRVTTSPRSRSDNADDGRRTSARRSNGCGTTQPPLPRHPIRSRLNRSTTSDWRATLLAPLERLFLPIDDGRSLLNGVQRIYSPRFRASQQRVAVGIIAAAANRSESLLRVIPSWLATNEVSEVVLVDLVAVAAVSSLPLPTDPRLRIVRAAGEFEWNLARAYNLALQLSNAEIVLKVDSDTWLDPEVLRIQLPRVAIVIGGTSGAFLRGCRDDAPDENARHLNGVILARRDDLLRVRGYDERMRKYGFDDTDLYARLSQARNLTGGCLRFDLMRHSPDGHAERGLTRASYIEQARDAWRFIPWMARGAQPRADILGQQQQQTAMEAPWCLARS